jgi:hypothetical protein
MNHRRRSATITGSTLLLAMTLVGCGDYAPEETGQPVSEPSAQPSVMPSATPSTPDSTVGPPAAGPVEVTCDMAAAPCGGDVSGTWSVVDCPLTLAGEVDMAGFGLGCLTGSVTSGTMQVTGTWSADTTGMFTDATTTTGMQAVELPPDCLVVSGTVTTCDRVGGPVQSSLGYTTFECVDNPATMGCSCTGTFQQEGGLAVVSLRPLDEGTYTTADTMLTMTDGRNETQYAHCVAGNAMVLTLAAPGKIGTVMGSIVMSKQ